MINSFNQFEQMIDYKINCAKQKAELFTVSMIELNTGQKTKLV